MDLLGKPIAELIKTKTDTPEDIFSFYSERIQKHNPNLRAFLHTAEYANPEDGSLGGIPLAIKDNIVTQGMKTTASAEILEEYNSPYEATISRKLLEAGSVYLGKTNMDAWAHGSSTETSYFGATKNPYDSDRVPGGSSGGSAVAVSAGLAPAAIGTETAGSIRLPAAWSGIVGLKPTYGRISRYGIIAMGSSWDCPGPMTQTVEDAALLLEVLAGKDPRDATSEDRPVGSHVSELRKDRKLTIGIADAFFDGVHKDIVSSVEECIGILEKLGHTIKKVDLMHPSYSISVYMLLQRSEVSSNLARYDGIRYGKDRSHFGQEAERRIMLGTYALSTGYYDQYYTKAQKVRYLIAENFVKAFDTVDVIMAPTTPTTALRMGESDTYAFFGEMMDVLTEPAAAAGIPAISIPSGFDSQNLPIGIQFMAKHFDEATVLQAAYQLERELAFDRLSVMRKYE